MASQPRCWCGSADLGAFSPDYLVCRACRTLVAASMPGAEITRVEDEERDFYGRRYWFEYQQRELGNPDITVRARNDLPERCVYWLRTVLRYHLPPARALDLACGHGAFVMLLRSAGYDAMGLELSPWVVEFVRKTFEVPVLQGPIEQQSLEAGSLDVITMMDVLEHLPEPVTTLEAVLATLDERGLLVIQTPAVPPDLSFEDMVTAKHPFLPLMRERGHLYLFNPTSLRGLLERVGMHHVRFEPAYFSAYDMFVVASRRPLIVEPSERIPQTLSATPGGRLVQALLDIDDGRRNLQALYEDVERDRAARLAALHEHGARLMGAEGERNALLTEIANLRDLGKRLAAAEVDRAARLAVIQELGERLAAAEADRAARLVVIQGLGERLAAAEADRAARLVVIQDLTERLGAARAETASRAAAVQDLTERLGIFRADADVQATLVAALRAELASLRFFRTRLAVLGLVRRFRAVFRR